MRSKTFIIILAVVLTLVLGALGFMVGLIMSSTKQEIVVQGDITENISELVVAEIAITTEETTTTVETTTITTTVTESEITTSVIETEKALDATYYRNYEPRTDKFVYNIIYNFHSALTPLFFILPLSNNIPCDLFYLFVSSISFCCKIN